MKKNKWPKVHREYSDYLSSFLDAVLMAMLVIISSRKDDPKSPFFIDRLFLLISPKQVLAGHISLGM